MDSPMYRPARTSEERGEEGAERLCTAARGFGSSAETAVAASANRMPEQTLQVLLVEDNPGDAVLFQEMLAEADPDGFSLRRAETLLEALDQIAEHSFDVIALDLNLPDSHGLETFTAMRSYAPRTPVVLLTGNDDDALAVAAVEAGAEDYLVKDNLDAERLAQALRYAVVRHHRADRRDEPPRDRPGGKLVAVLGSRGGVGGTTVACHLAEATARLTGERILLMDLDVESGNVGFLMQTQGPYGLIDAVENVHRLEEAFWRSLVEERESLDVLPSPGLLGQGDLPRAGRFRHLVRFAKNRYAWTVADLGRLTRHTAVAVREADHVAVITTTDLAAMHGTRRLLSAIGELGLPAAAVTIVRNWAGRWREGERIFEDVVKAPVAMSLPSAEKELTEACTQGRLARPESDFGRAVAALASRLTGTAAPEAAARRAGWKSWRLFSRQAELRAGS